MTPAKISATLSGQSNSPILGVLIMMASILTVTGLVGMGVVGFIISKE
jgi:branched-subunit amino acid permease